MNLSKGEYISDFKSYHVGGGNCVFFSATTRLREDVHKIYSQIEGLYNDPKTRRQVRRSAKTLIESQFKAGIINTSINPELQDYNFKEPYAPENIIKKIVNTEKGRFEQCAGVAPNYGLCYPQERSVAIKTILGNQTAAFIRA